MFLRHILRRRSSLPHRLSPSTTTTTIRSPPPVTHLHQRLSTISLSPQTNQSPPHFPLRTTSYSSAEEAAAARRHRKRQLRIQPPLNSLHCDLPKRDPNAPRLPDSTSSLVGARLNLHNRVQSLIRASDLDAASHLARHSVSSTTRPTVFTCNALVAAMYRSKRYEESISLFEYFFKQSNIVPNVVSYNQIINAHCDEGHVEEALEVYRYIIANAPFAPSCVTYRHLSRGLVQAGRVGEAVSLVREMLSKGQAADSVVYSNVIRGYLELGELDKANEFFDELKSKCSVYDGIVNGTFMEYWFEKGEDKEAMECYRDLLGKKFRMHPHTGNVLLGVFLKYGKKSEAWGLFNEMLDNHTPPNILSVNSETISMMVNECFKMGEFNEAIETFKKVGRNPTSRPLVMDYAGYSNIVTKFCEHGMLPEAESFFAESISKSLPPDAPSHRAMIDAYLKAERVDDALKMLNRMVDVNLRVVAEFGTRVFGELIRNGKVTECAEVLRKMGEREPKPDPLVYDVVVRGLCDGGALEVAKDVIGQMVGYGVGVTPVLREFVIETFEKAGRREEIEKTLNTVHRPGRNSGYTAPRVPSVLGGATSAALQQPRDRAPWTSHGTGFPKSGGANGTAGGTYKANNGQNPSSSNTSVNQQQQQPWSNQTLVQQPPSWSSQTPGYQQQQSWSQQPGWSSPSSQQQSWDNQTTGQQHSWNNQTPSQQQQWSNQNTGHQKNQTTDQQKPWSNQNTGHQQYQNTGHHQQQPWANQTPGQQQQWTNQTPGQHQQWTNQTPGQHQQWTNQTPGQHQQWTNQTATPQQSQWSNPSSGQVANQAPWSNSENSHLPPQQETVSSHRWQDGEEKNR
ncbi:unnamed protein product [Eruca vesicaria subsp. sativa]|uniref:Pentatricopeptide repeat-containing protein n=1 Tax=Eruca vesicaria subsp. sativa TaxID=29727 RepID=A0ABC8LKE7_ERUVS|nr:unnamed protein product [Eruca vesicaria subsp. sativa]